MHKALNQTLRLVLNGAQGVIAVNKPSVTAMQIAVLAVTATTAIAGPENGVITNGNGSIIQNGQITTIHQSSQTLNTTWESFNIDVDETVNFVQPNKNSLAVNNILDNNGSRILGNINANGQVWLINPNGVFFGRSAQVNVGSILAATLNPISKDTEGKQVFAGTGMGAIINQGNITAKDGYVAFIGNTVSNQGSIKANNGTVALAAGSQVSLKFADNQLVSLNVDKSTLDNLAENKQLIQANGGTVLMSAGAKDSLLASVVNNEGKIEAKTVEHKNGKIILMSSE